MILQMDLAIVRSLVLAIIFTRDMVCNLVEVSDSAQAVSGVVWQADVEKAAVLLSNESVHVFTAWSHQKKIIILQDLPLTLLCFNDCIGFQQLLVLVIAELIVHKFPINLVKRVVAQLAEQKLEVHAHVRMVMQWHYLSLLDEEEHETVIVVRLDGNLVQRILEVVLV